jgi:hypothetical protein
MTARLRYWLTGLIAAGAFFCSANSLQAQLYTGFGRTDFNTIGDVGVTINKPVGDPEGTLSNNFTTSLSSVVSGSPVTATVETYCIDIYHTNNGIQGSNDPTFQQVELISGSSFAVASTQAAAGRDTGFGTASTTYELAGLGRAAWLVNTFSTAQGVDKVALQLAVWKAEYEGETDSGNYANLLAGTISFTGINPNSQVGIDATNYLLASLNGGSTYSTGTGIWVSYQGIAQDQIFDPRNIPGNVPEPASLVMSGTALLAVAGLGLRRRKARIVQA